MTNELQTWTRSVNAKKAVLKMLADAPDYIYIESVEVFEVGDEAIKAFSVRVTLDNTESEAEAVRELVGNSAQVEALRSTPAEVKLVPVEEVDAEIDEWLAITKPKAKKKEADPLDEMDEYGAGFGDKDAKCPHCGINHIDNGWSMNGDDGVSHDERKFACLACNGEFGPKIGRRTFKGRSASLTGKTLSIAEGVANPYRDGTKSHEAFSWLASNDGATFEDFKAAGQRVRTLQEDVKNGRVVAE